MTLLPQSLFARLFAASIAVIVVTLFIVAVLIARERRELAFLGTGSWTTTKVIAETSETLAKLNGDTRAAAIVNLSEHPLVLEDLRERRPPPSPEELSAVRESFATQLRRQLGPEYGVDVQRASPDRDQFIRVETARQNARRARVPDDVSEIATERRRMLTTRILAWRYDVTVTLPDGQRVMFRANAPFPAPPLPPRIFIELGVLTGVLGLVLFLMALTVTRPLRDLANAADAVGRGAYHPPLAETGARELRRATRAFNTMQERLRRYIDSRTRVLAAMSHDLRTTLTRLRLRAETIENDELRARFSADLDEMSQMVHGALGLFRDLNDDEPLDTVDVDALLETLRLEFKEMDADVTVSGRTRGPISAKALALKRCLTNLLHNAIKYGTCAAVLVSDDDDLVIRIRDKGPGIPVEALDQVFEPFFRIEASRNRDTGGAGLGLSIARDIAQAHGGSIVLRNLEGGGLEVVLTLPRAASAAVDQRNRTIAFSSVTQTPQPIGIQTAAQANTTATGLIATAPPAATAAAGAREPT
jgi:signal transduction histidine kinase